VRNARAGRYFRGRHCQGDRDGPLARQGRSRHAEGDGFPPARYTRNYIQRDVTAEPRDDVDIVTELEFADADAYRDGSP